MKLPPAKYLLLVLLLVLPAGLVVKLGTTAPKQGAKLSVHTQAAAKPPASSINVANGTEKPPGLALVPADEAGLQEGAQPSEALAKMESALVLALEKSRGVAAFDPQAARALFIPMNDDGTLMVDLQAPASSGVLGAIAGAGGTVALSPDPEHIVSAMVPFSALEGLAARADVRSISIATRTFSSGQKPAANSFSFK